ncbi:MAG: hypothetical protein Q8P61_00830 [Candidatus Nanopelagicales bacterium]|nr:hypothetical protein [Candidatus Nanopelagicales bacterium]
MKRFFLTVFGIIVLLVGLAFTAVGGAVVGVVGSDGKYDMAVGSGSSQGYGLVFNQFEVTGSGQDSIRDFADITVGARSANGKDLFIGLAAAPDVAKYLAGVPHDVVTDVGSGRAVSIPGNTAPKSPVEQSIWLVSSFGLDPVVKLSTNVDKLTLVIMNLEPSTGVSADVLVGIHSGTVFPVGIALLVVGVIVMLLSIWIFVRASKAGKRKRLNTPPGGGAASGGPPPGAGALGPGYVSPGTYAQAPPTGYAQPVAPTPPTPQQPYPSYPPYPPAPPSGQ